MDLHGIEKEEILMLIKDPVNDFIMQMPTRKIDFHLSWQWAKNPYLKPKLSDLNDWTFLGMAVEYCDVVVAEKQFVDLITRDGFKHKATVVSDLIKLPEVLSN